MRSFSSTTMTSLKTIPALNPHLQYLLQRHICLRCLPPRNFNLQVRVPALVGPTDLIDPRRHQSHSIIARAHEPAETFFQVDSDVYCARPSAPFRRPCFPRSPTHPRSHCGSHTPKPASRTQLRAFRDCRLLDFLPLVRSSLVVVASANPRRQPRLSIPSFRTRPHYSTEPPLRRRDLPATFPSPPTSFTQLASSPRTRRLEGINQCLPR